MIIATHVPRPPLDQFVDWLWFHEGVTPGYPLERVLPDGSSEMIINLRDEPRHVFDPGNHRPLRTFRGGWYSGAHSEFIVIDTAADASMIGVHFKPGGAAAFLGVPANELQNTVVELEALWNGTSGGLRDRLREAATPLAKFGILEDALRRNWAGPDSRHPAVGYSLGRFVREPHAITIGQVTSEIGLSPRRFIQLFAEAVGMTPKLFCRVRRFQRVLDEIQSRRQVVWVDLAAACGYYDQAHFIHEFRGFCGLNPGEFLREEMEYRNFVAIRP